MEKPHLTCKSMFTAALTLLLFCAARERNGITRHETLGRAALP